MNDNESCSLSFKRMQKYATSIGTASLAFEK